MYGTSRLVLGCFLSRDLKPRAGVMPRRVLVEKTSGTNSPQAASPQVVSGDLEIYRSNNGYRSNDGYSSLDT